MFGLTGSSSQYVRVSNTRNASKIINATYTVADILHGLQGDKSPVPLSFTRASRNDKPPAPLPSGKTEAGGLCSREPSRRLHARSRHIGTARNPACRQGARLSAGRHLLPGNSLGILKVTFEPVSCLYSQVLDGPRQNDKHVPVGIGSH